ncbi:MAG: hypothetical protein HF307_19450 [Ignavibacteria bacterium]|jgi:hypothetical protein|nr:hypothetical protein [Ignavibacteria bacterium]
MPTIGQCVQQIDNLNKHIDVLKELKSGKEDLQKTLSKLLTVKVNARLPALLISAQRANPTTVFAPLTL